MVVKLCGFWNHPGLLQEGQVLADAEPCPQPTELFVTVLLWTCGYGYSLAMTSYLVSLLLLS